MHDLIIDLDYNTAIWLEFLLDFKINVDHLFNCSDAIVALGYHHVIHSICVSVDLHLYWISIQKLTLKVTKGQFQVKVMSKQNSQLITMVQFPTLSDISIKSYWQKTVFDPDLDLQSHENKEGAQLQTMGYQCTPIIHLYHAQFLRSRVYKIAVTYIHTYTQTHTRQQDCIGSWCC